MYNVAVTGLNAGDSPAPGVAVIRCLRERAEGRVNFIGLAYDALESGALDKQLTAGVYLLPYPKSGKEILLERLRYIHRQIPIDAVIPNLDAELPNFIQLRQELTAMGIHTFLPSEEQFKQRSKENLNQLCNRLGVKTPITRLVQDPSALDFHPEDFPVMVKGLFYEAYAAFTMEEAIHYIHKVAARWGYPVLVQEYLEGEEFNAAAMGDGTGRVLGVAGMKKLVFTDKGKGWACVSIENHKLAELTEQVVRAMRWRGPMEVEALQAKKDGEFYIIELNPRFPAWIYLAAAAGMNFPHLYLQLALGQPVNGLKDYTPGVVFTNYTTNLITDLKYIGPLYTNGELQHEKAI